MLVHAEGGVVPVEAVVLHHVRERREVGAQLRLVLLTQKIKDLGLRRLHGVEPIVDRDERRRHHERDRIDRHGRELPRCGLHHAHESAAAGRRGERGGNARGHRRAIGLVPAGGGELLQRPVELEHHAEGGAERRRVIERQAVICLQGVAVLPLGKPELDRHDVLRGRAALFFRIHT